MTREERHKKFEEYLHATPAERRKFDMSFLNEKSDLDEAAEKYAWQKEEPLAEGERLSTCFNPRIDAFIAGAEWMAGKWETIDGEITTTSDNGWEIIRIPKKLYPLGTKVTVKIRKK